jgi:hypothetical protein
MYICINRSYQIILDHDSGFSCKIHSHGGSNPNLSPAAKVQNVAPRARLQTATEKV